MSGPPPRGNVPRRAGPEGYDSGRTFPTMPGKQAASVEWTSGECPALTERLYSALDPYRAGKSEAGDAWPPGSTTLCGSRDPSVRLEMLRQQRNALAQQGNLYFWRPGIGFVALICTKESAALLQSPVPF